MRGDESIHDLIDITTGQIVSLELVDMHIEPGFIRLYERQDDLRGRHAAHAHTYERDDADAYISCQSRYPQSQRDEMQEQHHSDDDQY